MRKDVDRVAQIGGVTASDVIRMCVKHGLPAVEHGFVQMRDFVKGKTDRVELNEKGKKYGH